LDSVDKVIWILPFLAVADVATTLYVQSLGYSLFAYEAGYFALMAVLTDLIYVYAFVYVLIIAGFSFILYYIKKKLDPLRVFDKVLFLFLVIVTGYIYTTLTATFIGNLVMPLAETRGLGWWHMVRILAYFSCVLSLAFYLWHDVVTLARTKGGENEL
jgi:hypothetical protein